MLSLSNSRYHTKAIVEINQLTAARSRLRRASIDID
jgi:hypothetical protein